MIAGKCIQTRLETNIRFLLEDFNEFKHGVLERTETLYESLDKTIDGL